MCLTRNGRIRYVLLNKTGFRLPYSYLSMRILDGIYHGINHRPKALPVDVYLALPIAAGMFGKRRPGTFSAIRIGYGKSLKEEQKWHSALDR